MKKLLPLLGFLAILFALACIVGFGSTLVNTGSTNLMNVTNWRDPGEIASALIQDISGGLAMLG